MIEINDYFAISLLNAPNVEPPPRTVSSRAGEDSELRCSKHTRYPPQHFLLTLIDAIVATRRGGMLYTHAIIVS